MNCNRINREGKCDASEWVECTFCGAVDNAMCQVDKKPEPWKDTERHLADGLRKINSGESPAPYELVALVKDLMRRIEEIENAPNAEPAGPQQRKENYEN